MKQVNSMITPRRHNQTAAQRSYSTGGFTAGMYHRESSAVSSGPGDKRMMSFGTIRTLIPVVSTLHNVQQSTGWSFTRIIVSSKDLPVGSHADTERIPESTCDPTQLTSIG